MLFLFIFLLLLEFEYREIFSHPNNRPSELIYGNRQSDSTLDGAVQEYSKYVPGPASSRNSLEKQSSGSAQAH